MYILLSCLDLICWFQSDVTNPFAISAPPPAGDDDEDDFHDGPSSHASDLMTASYSEISFHGLGHSAAVRPASLAYEAVPNSALDSTHQSATVASAAALRDGPMTSFVADDLVAQIKLASPVQRVAGDLPDDATTPHVPRQFLQQSQVITNFALLEFADLTLDFVFHLPPGSCPAPDRCNRDQRCGVRGTVPGCVR